MPIAKCPKCKAVGECFCELVKGPTRFYLTVNHRYTFACKKCGHNEEKRKVCSRKGSWRPIHTTCPFCKKSSKEHLIPPPEIE